MLNYNEKNTYFLSCPRDCEELLIQELAELDIKVSEVSKGGVFFEEDLAKAFEALLHTRIASRIFIQLKTFKFTEENQISGKVFPFDWSELFDASQTFKVNTIFDRAAKKKFPNSVYFSQLVKDGIVDHFVKQKETRPNVELKFPDFSFTIRIEATHKPELWQAMVSMDLTGFALSNRGYRAKGHSAPLRENVAAAIVANIPFNPEEEVFIDSMAGSGTILIEAMLKHLNVSPSFLWIKKPLKYLSIFKTILLKEDKVLKSKLQSMVNELNDQNESNLRNLQANTYFAFDISGRYLDLIRNTITRTGLDWKKVRIVKKDALELQPPYDDAKGVIVCNPPYGKRIGEVEALEKTYYDYGENLKQNFKGFRAYVFTSNPELRKKISLQTSQRIPLFNGDLECRLLKYDLF